MSSGADASDGSAKVRRLFDEAAAARGDDRVRILARIRSTDPAACAELESLLQHHDRTNALIDRSPLHALGPALGTVPARADPAGAPGAPADEPPLPASFGAYTLLRTIGAGGMGVVYEAEQAAPRRRVAVKLIRPELISAPMLRRFEHEAEALGLLAHPGIAQIHEAGRAELAGFCRSFIAMELVAGLPLTEFARRDDLGRERRLALMAEVCDAIDSAHRRGVVHRDLKPGNILVTPEGRPKVLDFGVARLVGRDQLGGAGATSSGQIVGTLAYMSPEQAAGDPQRIDSRSDVYALGAILFELLCGSTPIDVSSLSLHSALSAIQSVPPQIPGGLRGALGSDARAILLKSLEKDPSRRYQHASDLAADIRRSLRRELITAREPSALYRAARFCARNKELVGAATLVATGLIVAVVVVSAALVRTDRARAQAVANAIAAEAARAEAEANALRATRNMQRFQAVSSFLHMVLRSARPEVARGGDTTILRAMLNVAEESLDDLADQPAAMADACGLLAGVYRDLGQFQRAEPLARRALDTYTQVHGERDQTTLTAMHNLGALYRGSLREYDKAEPLLTRAAELFVSELGPDHPETLNAQSSLSLLYMNQGRFAEAEPVLAAILAAHERGVGPSHPKTLRAAHNYCGALSMLGRNVDAEPFARRTLEARTRTLGEDHPDTATSLALLGNVLRFLGRADESVPMLERAATLRAVVLGSDHQLTIMARGQLAQSLRDVGRLEDAGRELEAVVALAETSLGPDHLETLQHRLTALEVRILLQRCEGAPEEAAELQAALARLLPPESAALALAGFCRGLALACVGDDAGGEAAMLAAWTAMGAKPGDQRGSNPTARRSAAMLAAFYEVRGRTEEAAVWRATAAPAVD